MPIYDADWLRAVMQDAATMAEKEGALVTAAMLKTALDAPDAEEARDTMAATFARALRRGD